MIWTLIISTSWAIDPPIVNGRQETGFPSTVALGADIGGYLFSACTGNLITPRIILSAAHCGEQIPTETIVQLGSAFFGDSIYDPTHTLKFSDHQMHPDYRSLGTNGVGDEGEFDISVFVLEEDAPIEPTLFRWDPISSEDEGKPMIAVGFGITSSRNHTYKSPCTCR